jgi:glycosyltransferase involved in cell wall biosynthesis
MIIIAPQFPPAFKGGGPTKSLHGVCRMFNEEGFEYTVVTKNKDLDGSLLPEKDFEKKAIYFSKIKIGPLKNLYKDSQLIWINTLYSPTFTIIPILALFFVRKKTVLLSPRGQLLKGAISLKKIIYLYILKFIVLILWHKIVIHFTNEDEKKESLPIFSNFKTIVFNNPVLSKNKNNFVISFFGRVSPIKNLEFILNLIPELPNETLFEIHGEIEDVAYKERLDVLIEELNISEQIKFYGNYTKVNFSKKAQNVDLFVIPSFSENFCHVFFEAIEQNKIVIASSGLPWKEANNTVKGTILPLEKVAWQLRINAIYEMSNESYSSEQNKLKEFYSDIKNSVKENTINSFKKLRNNYGTKR